MEKFPKITEHIEALKQKVGIPSCGFIIYKDHEKIYDYFTGYADSDKTKKADDQTLYFMYSCTKPMTITAGMMLWERGLLDLDAPVEKYLPEIADVFLIKDGERVRPKNTMTVRHLFTMTAGFNYDVNSEPIKAAKKASDGKATTREMLRAIIESPLSFEPGERFQYSLCHDVLACVIEVVSGERFADFMKHNIFDPLGMKNSYFHISEEKKSEMAGLYKWDAGKIVEFSKKNGYVFTDEYDCGGAGLITCASDYAIFADAMACGGVAANGYRLLKKETIDLIRKDALSGFIEHPESFSSCVGNGYTYGLGVRMLVDGSFGSKCPIGEFGWDGAAGSCFTADPENEISMVFVQHMLNWPSCETNKVHINLRNVYYETYADEVTE